MDDTERPLPETVYTCPRCRRPLPSGAAACPTCSASAKVAGESSEGPTIVLGSPDGAAQVAAVEPGAGMRFGPYTILREVARGAMGIVYQAKDSKLDRVVALKVLIAGELASPDQVARFQREAQAAAKLRHGNIVPIYDVGVAAGKHYFTMEFVEGKSLHDLLDEKSLSIDEAVRLVAQVADAMEHAHKQGVIHRDLKPANILVDAEGSVRVTDFGLSKAVHGSQLTESGTTLGTPSYMPPEQARGQIAEIDARSDVYSLGAILYEALAGRPPFVGETNVDTILKVLKDEPLPPRRRNAAVALELESVCLKALEKEKSRRYASAKEFGDDLRRYLAREPVRARPASVLCRWRRKIERHRVAVGIVAAVLLANAALIALLWGRKTAQPSQPPPVEESRWETRVDEAFRDAALPAWDVEGSWRVDGGALVGEGPGRLRLKEALSDSWALELKIDRTHGESCHGSLGDGQQAFERFSGAPAGAPPAGPSPCGEFFRVELRPSAVDSLGEPPQPPVRREHDGVPTGDLHPTLTLSDGRIRIVALRVFVESAAFRGSTLPVAEKLLSRGMYGLAKESYADFLSARSTGPLAEEARFGQAECAFKSAEQTLDSDDAEAAKELLAGVKDPRWEPLAKERLDACEGLLHAGAEAGGVGTLPGLTPSDPFNRLLAMLLLRGRQGMTPAREAVLRKAHDDAIASRAADKAAYDACMAWAGDRIVKRAWSEAEAACREALDRAPQEAQAVVWFLVEFCRFQRGDFPGVEEAARRVSDTTPKHVQDRIKELHASGKAGARRPLDMKKWREMLRQSKGSPELLENDPQFAEAKAMIELKALVPYLQYAHLLSVKATAYQGRTKEALAALQTLASKEFLDPAYEGRQRLLRGQVERLAGDVAQAMRAFEGLEKKGPDWLRFEATMQEVETSILADGGEKALALEAATRGGFKGAFERARMAIWFGLAHALAGDATKATAEWKEGLAAPGLDPAAHATLELALGENLQEGEMERAQLSAAEMKLWRGVALRVAGNREQATRHFESAQRESVGQEFPYEIARHLAGLR